MAEINLKKLKYELRDVRDESYLADMTTFIPINSPKLPYQINDEIELPDSLVHKNNSLRFSTCKIQKIESFRGSEIVIAYLMPLKKEYVVAGRYDGKKLFRRRIEGIDWSGSDNWLKL